MYIIKGWCSFLPNCHTGAGLLLLAQLYVTVHCSLTVQDCTAALPAPAHHLVWILSTFSLPAHFVLNKNFSLS